MAVSLTPARSWESGHLLLGRHLHTRLPWLVERRLQVPSPASCSPWRARLGSRGWEVGLGTERREPRPHLKGYFLSWLPLFSFSPHYLDVWCQTSSLNHLRWEMRCKVQTKKLKLTVDHFKTRGKCQLLFWGLLLIKPSVVLPPVGFKERIQVLFFF